MHYSVYSGGSFMAAANGSHTDRRHQTKSLVYHYIYDAARLCSKQDIARDLDLSLPTVYQNITALVEDGLIEYAGASKSTGGRPAMLLRIISDAKCAIGISIMGHCLRFAATDLSRRETAYKELPHRLNVEDANYSSFVASELEHFIDENGICRERILGVGITIAGIILQEDSTVLYAPTLYIRDLSLKALKNAIPYPVYIDNDATSGGFAEWYSKNERRNMAFLSLADGVGGAVHVNNEPYSGDNFRSGEFGHMCVEYNGKLCSCGRRGCLEAYCSAQRLSGELGMTLDEFFSNLQKGDMTCVSVWEDFKKHLVIGIHNIRMTLDCDIVLGGYLTEHLVPYFPELKQAIAESDPFDSECSYLHISSNSKYSSMLGVALTFIRDYLDGV